MKRLTNYIVSPGHSIDGFNGVKTPDPVIKIKAHWSKMHRLLFAFAKTGACIFSLNKNREIRTVSTSSKEIQAQKGLVVSIEWLGPSCKEFVIGFEKGGIEVYGAESSSQRPLRKLNFTEDNIKSMRLFFFQRANKPEYNTLVIEYSKDCKFNPMVNNLKDKVDIEKLRQSGS